MSPAALFRHHTGRMAGPARWYLAGVIMFSLGLLAAHFAVQEHIQKGMQQTVQNWLQKDGGSVQHVRYRLLRGALTLDQVHWAGGPDSGLALDISHIFIKTSSREMAKSTPFFPQLQLEHPVLRVPRSTLLDWLRGASGNPLASLAGLLPDAKAVLLSNMRVLVVSQGGEQKPREQTIRQVEGRFSNDSANLSGILGGGLVLLSGHMDQKGKLLASLSMHDVGMGSLAFWLGEASRGNTSTTGELQLSGDWTRRDIAMQGVLHLRSSAGNGPVSVLGGWSKTGMSMDMTCVHVALAALPFDWPGLAGRSPVAGNVNGALHVARTWQETGWHIGMNGELAGLQLEGPGLPAWHIRSMQLNKAELLPQGAGWHAAAVLIADADIVVDARAQPSGETPVALPEIASLSLQHIRPQLHFADGSDLSLPEMGGAGRLGKTSHLTLSSMQGGSDASDDGPDETWKVQADGNFLGAWQAGLTAKHVSVVRLRPVLPKLSLPGAQGIPDYSGTADLALHLKSAASILHMNGQAAFHDVHITQGGDQLNASRIDVDIADAASDGSRKLARVQINGWHYQMAIRPLSRLPEPASDTQDTAPPAQTETTTEESGQTAGQASESPALNWNIDDISAENGAISLGQPTALIAERLSLHTRHLARGSLSPFTLSGELAEGVLRSQGKWQFQPEFRMVSKTALYHALPFAFNEWMRLSGMPSFVRGRLDADLHIDASRKKGQPPDDSAYTGRLYISLHQGLLESGVFPDDPMLQRTGYSTQGLLERLNHARTIRLTVPFQGRWDQSSLNGTLGTATFAALKHAGDKARATDHSTDPPVSKVTGLRLQGKSGFSQNERVRLRQMIAYLLKNKKQIVELTPKLGPAPLNDSLIARIRFSQRLIEQFMRRRGIGSERIYPVWPQKAQQQGDASGLLLRARAR